MNAKRVVAAILMSSALALGSALATGPTSADTVINRTKGPTTDHNPLSGYEGYCTWGAQELIHGHTGYYVQALTGNAENWASQAQAAGWTVVSEAQPRSIAVYSSALVGGVGHVAWVEDVAGETMTVTEMNVGQGATAANGFRTTGFRVFDTRTAPDVPGMLYILIP